MAAYLRGSVYLYIFLWLRAHVATQRLPGMRRAFDTTVGTGGHSSCCDSRFHCRVLAWEAAVARVQSTNTEQNLTRGLYLPSTYRYDAGTQRSDAYYVHRPCTARYAYVHLRSGCCADLDSTDGGQDSSNRMQDS